MKTLSLILALALAGASAGPVLIPVAAHAAGQVVQTGKIVGVKTVKIKTRASQADKTGAAIVGGLAGAIVGNQFGEGSGKTVMTGAGAVGGALLGSKLADTNAYRYAHQWTVRLSNGKYFAIIQDYGDLAVGQRVRVVTDSRGTRLVP